MPRKPRVQFPGAIYHIVTRCDGRRELFHDEDHYGRLTRGLADEVKRFAPSIDLAVPNGMCMSDDGFLYLAEHNRVLVFPAAEFFYEGPDVAVGVVVDQGTLVPTAEESFFEVGAEADASILCRPPGIDHEIRIGLGTLVEFARPAAGLAEPVIDNFR